MRGFSGGIARRNKCSGALSMGRDQKADCTYGSDECFHVVAGKRLAFVKSKSD